MEKTYISIQTSLTVTVIVGLFFIGLGYFNSKKVTNNKNYIVDISDTYSKIRWKPEQSDTDMIIEAYEHWKNIK